MDYIISKPTRMKSKSLERFTTQAHGYRLDDLSLHPISGHMAVSGHNFKTEMTFIDVYARGDYYFPGHFTLLCSKEFEKYSNWPNRFVTFLESDRSKIVTCIGNKIEIMNTRNEWQVLKDCQVNESITCVAVRKEEIFIGLHTSQTIIVFDNDLNKMKTIDLIGILFGGCLKDLKAIKDTLLACTAYGKALSICESDGHMVKEYTDITSKYDMALSITVSEGLHFLAVAYGHDVWGGHRIIVYSLEDKTLVLAADVDVTVSKVRFCDKPMTLITGSMETGEIKTYDLEELISYHNMKEALVSELQMEECKEILKLLEPSQLFLSYFWNTKSPIKTLLFHLQEKDVIKPSDVDSLAIKLREIGSPCYNVVDTYQKSRPDYEARLTNKKLMEVLKNTEQAWNSERQQLNKKLEDTKKQFVEEKKIMEEMVKRRTEELEESTREKRKLLTELKETRTTLELSQQQTVNQFNEQLEKIKHELELKKLFETNQSTSEPRKKRAYETATPDDPMSRLSDKRNTKFSDTQGTSENVSNLLRQQRSFQYLSKSLASEWLDVGRNLGMVDDELNQIKADYGDKIEETIYQMLLRWKKKEGHAATTDTLSAALELAGRKDLADNIPSLEG